MLNKIFKKVLNTVPRPLLIRLSYFIRPFLVIGLRGNRYQDPIDGRRFSRFLPYGYGQQRQNVLSPSTLSLERHRLLWLYLERCTDFFTAPRKVLHFAPEQAFYNRFRKMKHLEYTTTDLHSPLADVKADICELPFADDAYDFVLCNHVLEHIPDDDTALKEIKRVLKPGGIAILQIPQDLSREKTFEDNSITDRKERARIFGQYDHVRVYGRDFFEKLRKTGFEVQEVDLTSDMDHEEINRYRLSAGEIIPVVRKPVTVQDKSL